jgi:DNA-binding CsgD family transcriptional regulator
VPNPIDASPSGVDNAVAPPESGVSLARPPWDTVGRDVQVEAVDAARAEVRRGEPRAVFFTGVRGAGRPHLLADACHRLREAGWVVLPGACLDAPGAPLYPLRTALRRLRSDPAATAAQALLTFLESRSAWPGDPGELLERLSAGLTACAAGRPLALVIDDLQWLDPASRRLIRYLLSGLARFPALVVGAAWLEPGRDGWPLLGEWSRLRSVRVIEVPAQPPRPGRLNPLKALTARELEVLRGMAADLSHRQLAARLEMSEKTVSVHASRIYRKLRVAGKAEACAVYRRYHDSP